MSDCSVTVSAPLDVSRSKDLDALVAEQLYATISADSDVSITDQHLPPTVNNSSIVSNGTYHHCCHSDTISTYPCECIGRRPHPDVVPSYVFQSMRRRRRIAALALGCIAPIFVGLIVILSILP
ncbi:hypothetical protein RCL1_001890 [Eukaryota sp. TZLM3-RCL]